MDGRARRRKGHDFERKVARLFREAGYPNAVRGQQTRRGPTPPDVDGTPFWIECKKGKNPNPLKAYDQALDARYAMGDSRPVLVVYQQDFDKVRCLYGTKFFLLADFLGWFNGSTDTTEAVEIYEDIDHS